MSIHPAPDRFRPATVTALAEPRDLLRFITCGSVDDGKSTLIGRLLFESRQLFDDQLAAIARDSVRSGTQGGEMDLALALDGLAAEREQGITIDVAYRFFSTEQRSFIVADTPGHEQYTRNMATGASTADVAVLLVDARKGLSAQTKRHSLIVSMLGIRHVVVAVNKMDLVDWSEETFGAIVAAYRAFAADLAFTDIVAIPMSARSGDNVTARSARAPWYAGPDLLGYLDGVEIAPRAQTPFRLAVQWVNRPDLDFRGFAGLVSGSAVHVGQPVRVLPSGVTTRVARIVTYDGDLATAIPGESVTLTLADEVDASRGSVIAALEGAPALTDTLRVRLFWMAATPLRDGADYLAKIGTQRVRVTVAAVRTRIDLDTLEAQAVGALAANDVGDVTLHVDRLVSADTFDRNRDTGSLVLIDRETYDTVAMALVLDTGRDSPRGETGAPDAAQAATAPGWLSVPFATPWRSALKAASWRVLGTGLTFGAAYLLTGDLRIASLLGAFELLVKFALNFGHERLWVRLGLGLVGPARSAGR